MTRGDPYERGLGDGIAGASKPLKGEDGAPRAPAERHTVVPYDGVWATVRWFSKTAPGRRRRAGGAGGTTLGRSLRRGVGHGMVVLKNRSKEKTAPRGRRRNDTRSFPTTGCGPGYGGSRKRL